MLGGSPRYSVDEFRANSSTIERGEIFRVHQLVERHSEERFFCPEIITHERWVDARIRSDVTHADLGIAATSEESLLRLQKGLFRAFCILFLRGGFQGSFFRHVA